jgi:hypothetical protein
MTSLFKLPLTHPRKTLLVVLQIGKGEIGKAKYLSAPLRIAQETALVNGLVGRGLKRSLEGLRKNFKTL